MKKTLCIVLITAMLLSVMPMVVFADTPEGTAITSASQLLGMSKTDTGNYYLANDITISGYWTGENFYGNLDGNGHTIYIENGATIKNGIFNGLWGSYVKNLNIIQLGTAYYQARSSAVGVLTRGVNNNDVTISNVYIKADMSNVLTDGSFTGGNASNVAAFVGQILANNEGPKEGMSLVMENCVFEGKIVKADADTGRATAAMVAGTSLSGTYPASLTIRNCINYGDITSGSPAGSMLGRPIGSDDGQGSGLSSITITGCINYGDITVTGTGEHASAGGILGKVEQEANATLTVTNNINYGNVSALDNAGGIAGGIGGAIRWNENSTLTSNGNVNYGTMSATNIGAIMGSLWQRNDTSGGEYSHMYNYCNAIQQEEAHNGALIDADTMTNLATFGADLYTKLPNGKITLTWAKEAGYADATPAELDATLVGAQLSGKATDETRNIRFVGGLTETEGLTNVGVLIIATYANGESRKVFEGKTDVVYESIMAGGEDVYATEYQKTYFFTAVVNNIPTELGEITFEIRTFQIAEDGSVVYSDAKTASIDMAYVPAAA